tara:strand:+ start:228 stop:587 length:360 start_codon:yes stop_codon:yes gene_type:complete
VKYGVTLTSLTKQLLQGRTSEGNSEMNNDINFTAVDTLGSLLAQIADLTKQADAIKDSIKESASAGGAKVVEGALFKATYIESNRSVFDKDAFIKVHGAEAYAAFTKVSAVFSVKVTSK